MENAEIWENEAQFNLDAGSALVKERDDQIADLTRRLELAEAERDAYRAMLGVVRELSLQPEFFRERRLRICKNLIGHQWFVRGDGDINEFNYVRNSALETFEALKQSGGDGGSK